MSSEFIYTMVRGPEAEADESGCVTLTVEELRCLSGKHEKVGEWAELRGCTLDASMLTRGWELETYKKDEDGENEPLEGGLIQVCRHCRSLFVERA